MCSHANGFLVNQAGSKLLLLCVDCHETPHVLGLSRPLFCAGEKETVRLLCAKHALSNLALVETFAGPTIRCIEGDHDLIDVSTLTVSPGKLAIIRHKQPIPRATPGDR